MRTYANVDANHSCCHCLRGLTPKKDVIDRPVLCGCSFCQACFEISIDVQLNYRYKPYEERNRIKCLGCPEESKESYILPSDCRNIDSDLAQRYNSAMYDIYASKRACAANLWINTCRECKYKARIPKPLADQPLDPAMSPKKSIQVYKCPGPRCRLVYCSTCGQCIYNRYQYELHRCSLNDWIN